MKKRKEEASFIGGKRIHKAHPKNLCSSVNTVGYGFCLLNIFEASFQFAKGQKPMWLNNKVKNSEKKRSWTQERESKEEEERKEEKKPLRDDSADGNQQ